MSTSFSRLGSANTYDNAMSNLADRQAALSDQMERNTAGKRVVRASDDPTGAAQAERALTRISRIATDQRALESQRSAITIAESTLGDVYRAMDNFRELVVSAGNGGQTGVDRKTIVNQLAGLRDQIFSLSNRKDSNGQPLFSALGSALAPFTGPNAPPLDYTFNGLPGQSASNEFAIPSALDGEGAFMLQSARDGVYNVSTSTIPSPRTLTTSNVTVTNTALVTNSAYGIAIANVDTTTVPGTTTVTYNVTENPNITGPFNGLTASYPSTQSANFAVTAMPGLSLTITGTPAIGDTLAVTASPSVFSVLDNAIRDIGSAVNGNAATQAVAQALGNIDIGMSRVSAIQGQAGDLLNRADNITSDQTKRSIQMEADRSRAEDMDMIKGLSDYQKQQTGYQVALQSYAQIQKLSLFNYIS